MAAKKPGKWSHLIGKLPKLSREDAPRQEKLDIFKEEVIKDHREKHGIPPTAAFLVSEYMDLRALKDKLEAELSEVQFQLDAITQMTEAQYEAEGATSLRLESGGSLGIHYEPYAVVVDRDKNRQWAMKNGFGPSLILPWQTLNAELKRRMEAGEPEPDGVEAFLVTKFTKRG